MKKLFLLVIISILAVSCTTEEYYTGDRFFNISEEYNVKQNMWVWDSTLGYYYCDFRADNIDSYVCDYGTKSVEILVDVTTNGKSVWAPLPYDFYGMDGTHRYTVQYSYEIEPGWVRFTVKYNDFDYKNIPNPQTFSLNIIGRD